MAKAPKRKLTEEHRRNIRLSRQKQEAEKRITLELGKIALQGTGNNLLSLDEKLADEKARQNALLTHQQIIPTRSDVAHLIQQSGLTLAKCVSVLKSTQSGKLRDWALWCHDLQESDPLLTSLVTGRINEVAGKRLITEPVTETEEERLASDFAGEVLANIPYLRTSVAHLLRATFTGLEVAEIVWKTERFPGTTEHFYYPSAIVPIHLSKLELNEDLEVCLAPGYQTSGHDDADCEDLTGVPLRSMPHKFIIHTPAVLSTYPNLDGLFRPASKYSVIMRKSLGIWIGGAEKSALPTVIVTVPNKTPDDLLPAIRDDFEAMAASGVVVAREGVKVTQATSGDGGASVVFQTLQGFLHNQLIILMTGGTLTVDPGSGHSYALGNVHERKQNSIIKSDAEKLAETLREQLIRPLFHLNRHLFKPSKLPTLEFDGIEQYEPLTQWHIASGVFTKNDIRRDLSYPSLPATEGGNEFYHPDPSLMAAQIEASKLQTVERLLASGVKPEALQGILGAPTATPEATEEPTQPTTNEDAP